MKPSLSSVTALALLLAGVAPSYVTAQEPVASAAPAADRYSVESTPIGALLDDPDACAVLDRYIPGFSTNDQVDLARDMTLRGIQPYAEETMGDDVLAMIEAELGKLGASGTAPGG